MKLIDLLERGEPSLIQETLQKRFSSNLSFFSSLNPKLYEQLILPPKQYNLFFDQHGLNLIHLQNKSLVYPKIQDVHTLIQTHKDLANSPLQNPKWSISHNNLYLQKMDENTFPITGQAINQMINSLDQLGGVAHFHLPSFFLPSTCIYGALGGLFVQFLLEEGMFFHSLLWFEEEMDFFRISCFFVDFALLFERCSKRSCYLFVQDLIHRHLIKSYFQSHKITNNFLNLELSLYSSPKIQSAKQLIHEMQAQNSRGWGSFEDEMIGFQNTLKNLTFLPPTLTSPKRIDIPICVVGNGSSLDSLLPFIRQNQEKMIIFSCGTALKVLKNHEILPDFQIEIERIDYLYDVLLDAPLKDTPLIAGNMLNPKAFSLAKEHFLFMRGGSAGAYLLPSFVLELSSPFVGNAGVALACALGSDVILCGLDCGYIQGQSKHAKGSFYGQEGTQIPKDAFEVKGNQSKKVYSTSIFALSIEMMSLAISHFKPNFVLNLGEGAYIQGARSIKPSEFDLKLKDKQQAIKQLKQCFTPQLNTPDCKQFLQDAHHFIEEIKQTLLSPIHSKIDLFNLIDSINASCVAKSITHPSIGILLDGSICHLLHNLMMCALHYPHNDISPLYHQCLEILLITLDKYKLKLRFLMHLHSTPNSDPKDLSHSFMENQDR
ncbi:6-hydroxymethylpterin diphosphokinase MptE-like protein [Helicobacter pametensis]|uniref:motility associated factor glycosyltransferase family protein n=1 Tax=Helicobacter pametensis TaxID=95149 RepID=UPI0004B179DA|nr:6-hydroxymethylpterin diphosphokinase MptE-like protein [Helicobacter pametensis]